MLLFMSIRKKKRENKMIIRKKKYKDLKENILLKERLIEDLKKSNKILENNNKKMTNKISEQRKENITYQEQINEFVNNTVRLDTIILKQKNEIKRLKTLLTKNDIDYKKKIKEKGEK